MERNWEAAKLGDYFDLIGGYAFKSEDFVDSGVPVIKIKNVKSNRMLYDDLSHVDSEFLKTRADKIIKRGDLLITMSGNRLDGSPDTWVGKVAQFNEERPYLLNQRVGILRPKNGTQINRRFFSYSLSSSFYQNEFIAIATSSGGQANLSPSQILGAPIEVPPLTEQKAIAAVLGALDELIELNRRMNATLEAMARAVFRSWFVDFDPVHAKLDGRQPTGLDPAIAALFPNEFQDSELGPIPCVGGSTPSTAEPKFWEGGTHCWATPKDLSGLQAPILVDTERRITNQAIAKISSGLLPAGTLLLSSRAPVGYLAIATMPVAINQGFIAMKCNERASNYFMLNWCRSNMSEIESRASGTTFAEISKRNFRPIPLVLPPTPLIARFTQAVQPMYAQIALNVRQSRTLASTRDALLPKLLSGQLKPMPRSDA